MFLTDRHGACPYITEGEHALLRRLLPRPLGEGRVREDRPPLRFQDCYEKNIRRKVEKPDEVLLYSLMNDRFGTVVRKRVVCYETGSGSGSGEAFIRGTRMLPT